MENSSAAFASTLSPKSNASAAASKAGPRFADVAGRNMRKKMPERSRESGIALVLRLERLQNGVGVGVQHDRRFPLLLRQRAKLLIRHSRNRQIAAMKLDGVLGVLQYMSG